MRLPNTAHDARPWRIREIAPDFTVEDVWALPVHGGAEDFQTLRVATGAVGEFEAQRPRMFGLAYRLLGSAQEAEDVVQDTFLRWHRADRAAIAVPSAWLAKVVTNLCLNRLASARVQRERYVGPWLPEPVLTSDGTLGPLDTAEQRDSVSLALLVLLERLTPTERAVFVLREAFGYSHREIAQILELSEINCRQLARRARRRLAEPRPRFRPEPRQWHRLVERFLLAAREGDLRSLQQLLAAEVTAWADGGGKVTAARRPVVARPASRATWWGAPPVRRWRGARGGRGQRRAGGAGLERRGPSGCAGVGDCRRTDRGAAGRGQPDKLGFAARQAAGLSRPGVPIRFIAGDRPNATAARSPVQVGPTLGGLNLRCNRSW
jgi:RNA polymerase sigma factor (sigma-70 family)